MAEDTTVRKTRALGHAVGAGTLLTGPLTFALVYAMAFALPWVGGSDVPAIVMPVVLAPAVITGLAGLVAGVLGVKRRVWSATVEGGFAVLCAVVIFMLGSMQVGMLSII
jgi:hypothetical protein